MDLMENTKSLNTIALQHNELLLAHTSDVKRLNEKITAECKELYEDFKQKCIQLEAENKLLQQREDELKKTEVELKNRERKLVKEKSQLEFNNRARELLSSCKQLDNKSSRKEDEDRKCYHTRPKVYNIDSDNFKETVRVLTSNPEFQYPSAQRLKDIAPPPLVLSKIPKASLFPKPTPPSPRLEGCNLLNETLHTTRFTSTSSSVDYDASSDAMISPLFKLSPASLSWCSSFLLSPGNLSAIN